MAPKKAVGKRVRCPHCNKVITVPDPGSTVDRMLYSLLDDEYNKPALEEQPPPQAAKQTAAGKLCPKCSQEIAKEAVFCIKCGFHLEKGGTIATATGPGEGQLRSALRALVRKFKR